MIFFLGWTILLPTYTSGNDAEEFMNTYQKEHDTDELQETAQSASDEALANSFQEA